MPKEVEDKKIKTPEDDSVEVDTKKEKTEKDDEDDTDEKEDVKESTQIRFTEAYRQEDQPEPKSVGGEDPFKKSVKKEVSESVVKIFDGEDLSEDFKTKASTIIEAVVVTRINEELEKIEALAQTKFNEELQKAEASINEKVDEYLDYVVTEWKEENKIAIEQGLKAQIAESFLEDLKALFEAHNISLPEEKVDLLDEATQENEKLLEDVTALTNSLIEAKNTIFELEKKEALRTLSEGMIETHKEKLVKLLENVEANNLEIFKEKAKTIKESIFKEEKPSNKKDDSLENITEQVDPSVQKYLEWSKRINAKE